MREVLIACGDVELLRQLVSELPEQLKPIATKRGLGTAAKLAQRQLELAIIHEQLEDQGAAQLLADLKALPAPPSVVWLTQGQPPRQGAFDRALRYPVPGPVLRAAIQALLPEQADAHDLERWRAFYRELKERHEASASQDYYALLGLPKQAPHHRIVAAFDQLSLRYHPDRYNQFRQERWGEAVYQEANALYKLITEAYSVLTDRRLLEQYTKALERGELRLSAEQTSKKESGPKSLEELGRHAQSKKFLRMAQTDLANQRFASALQNMRFAQSMEPDNLDLRQKIQELEAKLS